MLLFGLGSTRPLAHRIAEHLGVALAPCEERAFEDGEHKTRPLTSVRGQDVYVVHALHGEPAASGNDKLCRLLFFLGALRDADAARVTAIVPYLCYARKDRRTKPHDPVTTRYVAALFEAVGLDRIAVLDVHNRAAFDNAFRRVSVNVEARPALVEAIAERLEGRPPVVVSPDVGGVHRADELARSLSERLDASVEVAFMEKRRSEGVVSGEALVGRVSDRVAVLVDDLVATGTTLVRAADACRRQGATGVVAAATHGVFTSRAGEVLGRGRFEHLWVTDSVVTGPLPLPDVEVVPIAPVLARSIQDLAGS